MDKAHRELVAFSFRNSNGWQSAHNRTKPPSPAFCVIAVMVHCGHEQQKASKISSVHYEHGKGVRLWLYGSGNQGLPAFVSFASEPRGCPEIISHTVVMSESPIGPKPTMLRADMPATPNFQQVFASSCTVSSNGPGQRRER